MSKAETAEATTQHQELQEVTTSRALARIEAAAQGELGAASVDHVVDFHRRYPGEVLTFFTRVSVWEPLSDLTLRISLPPELTLDGYRAPPELEGAVPYVEAGDRVNYLVWSLDGELPAGTRYEYRVQARIAATERGVNLESRARLISSEHGILAEESVTFTVWATGKYLRYLPALYEQDGFMGRFLMLFESFWAPIEMQVDNVRCYLDPGMTPTRFLPWLAGWLGLELDGRLPGERQRQLIQSAISLHRRRGTKQALREYLEIYTDGEAQIIEHRAENFRLGPGARLGPGVALGLNNRPHTFTVVLHVPPVSSSADESELARLEAERRRTVEAIIEAEKPAHTGYTLRIEALASSQ
jgi:phage tail-like protein